MTSLFFDFIVMMLKAFLIAGLVWIPILAMLVSLTVSISVRKKHPTFSFWKSVAYVWTSAWGIEEDEIEIEQLETKVAMLKNRVKNAKIELATKAIASKIST